MKIIQYVGEAVSTSMIDRLKQNPTNKYAASAAYLFVFRDQLMKRKVQALPMQREKLVLQRAIAMCQDIKTALILKNKISNDVAICKGSFKNLPREEAPITCQREIRIF